MKSPLTFLSLISLTIAAPLEPRAADTFNDLTNGSGCKAMTVVFARGTTETGNVGTLAGPPFFNALSAKVGAGNMAVQGVDYPADIPGFLAGGDKAGSALMAKMVGQAMTQCPNTKVVMAGYSQGGQLVHNAAKMLSASQSKAVSSAVIFGDPNNGDAVGSIPAAKTKVICHTGDNICAHGDVILAPHLTYGNDAGTAASFAASAAGM
ncbi:related to cutinase precursor [Phialocephala subalpina]|uniref:cutinase n=1 Tax=Phialocephala subalpina TaxID=576137 RepID=A0A1L7XCA4_9HELO|nr:related to cutinase precursor [Phialocephala subalpina]